MFEEGKVFPPSNDRRMLRVVVPAGNGSASIDTKMVSNPWGGWKTGVSFSPAEIGRIPENSTVDIFPSEIKKPP